MTDKEVTAHIQTLVGYDANAKISWMCTETRARKKIIGGYVMLCDIDANVLSPPHVSVFWLSDWG